MENKNSICQLSLRCATDWGSIRGLDYMDLRSIENK